MPKSVVIRVLPRSRPGRKHLATVLVALSGVLTTASCTTPLPPDAIQRIWFDEVIAEAEMRTTVILYDNHIAGKLTGAVDVNVGCPNGGTARIAGTVTPPVNAGLTSVDLTFHMNACYAVLAGPSGGHTSLRTTGIIRKTASFNASTASASYNSSGDLAVSGTLKIVSDDRPPLEPSINESCAFAATATRTTASGTYCGRPFSW